MSITKNSKDLPLSEGIKANVLKASSSPMVQKRVVECMFDTLDEPNAAGIMDVWDYIQDQEYPSDIRDALFGTANAVKSDWRAIDLLITNVKQIVLDSFDISEGT